jgi:hypothetical protein
VGIATRCPLQEMNYSEEAAAGITNNFQRGRLKIIKEASMERVLEDRGYRTSTRITIIKPIAKDHRIIKSSRISIK